MSAYGGAHYNGGHVGGYHDPNYQNYDQHNGYNTHGGHDGNGAYNNGYNEPQAYHGGGGGGYENANGPPPIRATFQPGGGDDYYMPELISPAPQRIMPEVPENMQQNIAHLEQEARGRGQLSPTNSVHYNNERQSLRSPPFRSPTALPESPNFSPFPVIHDHPPNVPPTDEQREATLEAAREEVLASNDPENQLTWAQDALIFVDIANTNEKRVTPRQGIRPHTPTIERQLRDDAMNIVRFLAEQTHPRAQYMMGTWLEFGKYGYRVDKKEAFHCYTRAAEKGFARAEYRIGMQFENSGEPVKAIKYYQKGADAGDSASHYRLGMMKLLGQNGQIQDFKAGLQHIFTAAQTADETSPQGAYVFGLLQARQLEQVQVPPQFLPLDIPGARMNIEKAAYLGFAKAQVKMGAAYELSNLGCDFNPALSLHYNSLAARQGEAEAEMAISKWFLSGYEGVFKKNEEMAFIYAERAASSGLETAEFALGYFYEVGIWVQSDLKLAREWYEKAASKGNTDAKGRINALLHSQVLSRSDHERIALSKIRQQYGSQNQDGYSGNNSQVNMPDPMNMRPQQYPPGSQNYPMPARGSGSGFGPGPAPGSHRPNSAFGINPNIRPGSAATMPPGPPRAPVPPDYQRPYTSMSDPRAGYGRGGPRPGPPPGQMGYPPRPGPGMPPQGMNRPPPNQRPGPPPDIGFTAPPDPTGADRRQRFGPGQAYLNGPPTITAGGPPPRGSSRGMDPGYGGPRSNSGQPMPQNPRPNNENRRPSAPANPPAPVAPAAPKGPKTFEEMGVPAQKNGDCIVM